MCDGSFHMLNFVGIIIIHVDHFPDQLVPDSDTFANIEIKLTECINIVRTVRIMYVRLFNTNL